LLPNRKCQLVAALVCTLDLSSPAAEKLFDIANESCVRRHPGISFAFIPKCLCYFTTFFRFCWLLTHVY